MLGFLSFDREAEQYLCAAVLAAREAGGRSDGTRNGLRHRFPEAKRAEGIYVVRAQEHRIDAAIRWRAGETL